MSGSVSLVQNRWLASSVCVAVLCVVGTAAGQSVGSEIAPLGLPVGFSVTAPDDQTAGDLWELTPLNGSPLTVSVAHPKAWVVGGTPDIVFIAQPPDGSLSLAMMPPIPSALGPLEPATNKGLGEATDTISSAFQRPIAGAGQARIGDRLWYWFDLGISDAPPAASPTTAYQWVFTSVVENQQVILVSTVRIARSIDAQEREAQTRRAGPVFARMLEGISFTRTP